MAALPPDNTARYRVNYTTVGKQHAFQVRSAMSPSAFGTFVNAFLNQLSTVMYASTVADVVWAPSGSSVFNPVTTGAEGHTWGSGAGTVIEIPQFVNFIGRTSGGHRVRLAVFGVGVSSVDYRFLAGENSAIDNTINHLVLNASTLLGIDGLNPVWKNYANTGFNAYWQKAVRP